MAAVAVLITRSGGRREHVLMLTTVVRDHLHATHLQDALDPAFPRRIFGRKEQESFELAELVPSRPQPIRQVPCSSAVLHCVS